MTTYRPTLRRRELLRRLGLGAAAAYLAPHGNALGQATAPTRLLILWGGTGCVPGRWEPLGEAGAPSEHAWRLNSGMAALAPHRDRLLLFRDLDMLSALGSTSREQIVGHTAGRLNSLVAQGGAARPEDAQGISIDQLISQRLNADGPLTRVPNVVAARSRPWLSPSWLGPGEQVPAMGDLRALYDLLFPDSLRPSMGDTEVGPDPSARGARILSLIRADHEEFSRRLPALHRERLDAHMDLRSRLEALLEAERERVPTSPGPEAWPDRSLLDPLPDSGEPERTLRTALGIELSVAAFHADVTRVATVTLEDVAAPGMDYDRYREANESDGTVLQALHRRFGNHEASRTDEYASDILEASYRIAVGHVRRAADLLAERRDVNGRSLLESTLIVMCPHIARGGQTAFDLPWLTLGNLNGYFRTGRLLHFGLSADGFGRAHGDLWTSVANGMGVPIDRFGLRSRGPIAQLV